MANGRLIRCALCVALCAALSIGSLWYINRVLIVKRVDGITTMQDFYAQKKNTVDVLMIGSSHCGQNIDVETLWSEEGIAGYSLWGSSQPLWNSYYFLLEALKTQSPKVVVLETLSVTKSIEYSDEYRQVTNTAGMRFSKNKWEAVKASAMPEDRLNLFFGMPHWHQRYGEVVQDDFKHFPWTKNLIVNKGTLIGYGSNRVNELHEVTSVTDVAELPVKQEEYLRKFIELCQARELPLVLCSTLDKPTESSEFQRYYNRVNQITQEYGVPYLNTNLLQEEIGFTTADYCLDNGHLNTAGARKTASYLGKELKRLFDIPDRRGDPGYASWDEYKRQTNIEYLKMITRADDYFSELRRESWTVFAIQTAPVESAEINTMLSELGMPAFEAGTNAAAYVLPDTLREERMNVQLDGSPVFCGKAEVAASIEEGLTIKVNAQTNLQTNSNGVVLVVFDMQSGEYIDAVCLCAENNWEPARLNMIS